MNISMLEELQEFFRAVASLLDNRGQRFSLEITVVYGDGDAQFGFFCML